jgi:hypothetical protein
LLKDIFKILLISSASKAKLFSINKPEMNWNGGRWNHGCLYLVLWPGPGEVVEIPLCQESKPWKLMNNYNQSFQGAV